MKKENFIKLIDEMIKDRDHFHDEYERINKENEKLKQQIINMKCCENCKHEIYLSTERKIMKRVKK